MWLSLLLLILLLVIAFSQSTQGLFSALIMAVLTICCAAAALGTYEWVAIHWLAPYWKPGYALPISLGVTFGLPLLLLRLVFDQLIRRSSLLPAWVDRIGGGACGFVTALTMVGILAICVQMVPFGGPILGHSRVAVADSQSTNRPNATPPDPDAKERELLPILSPDRFALAVAWVLSDGTFSGKHSFHKHNPDLVQTVGWVGATHAEVSRYAPPKSISVVGTRPLQFVYRMIPSDPRRDDPPTYEPESPKKDNYKFRMVQVQLRDPARDKRKSHIFTLRQFRLVGQVGGSEAYVQYHPIAIQQEDANDPTNRHVRYERKRGSFWPVVDEIYAPRSDDNRVEIVFELPTGFKPAFLEYKRESRARLSFEESLPAPQASANAGAHGPAAASPRAGNGADSRRGGKVRGVEATRGQSRFSDELPMTMRSYRRIQNVAISRGALADGHLVGVVDEQEGGRNPPVSKFDVPRDKRLLQLSSRRLKAGSTLGRALSQAVTTLQNYYVEDTNGRRYKIVGKYAIADARGRKYIEIQYFSHGAGTIGGVGKFSRINERNMKDDDEFVLLFLVDPGAHITSFSTGGAATRRDDLVGENLIAPP